MEDRVKIKAIDLQVGMYLVAPTQRVFDVYEGGEIVEIRYEPGNRVNRDEKAGYICVTFGDNDFDIFESDDVVYIKESSNGESVYPNG